MTFIAVCCPHCQSDQIVKHGKTARGTQRYLCQNTLCPKGSFLLAYCNRGCLPEVKQTIIDMSLNSDHSGQYRCPHPVAVLVPERRQEDLLPLRGSECRGHPWGSTAAEPPG